MEQNNRKDILYLYIAVMLFSISGVVAQFVEVPSVLVAMGRVITSSIVLFAIAKVKKDSLRLECKKDYLIIMATGVVLAVHWTTFFQSIQVSSVAIGTITFSTFPLFLTFLVPAVWRPVDIAGVVCIGCVCTAFAYSLYVSAQKKVKAQTAGIISGMETVYGIVYALIFLGEVPCMREIIGGIVILSVALVTSLEHPEEPFVIKRRLRHFFLRSRNA